MTITKSVTHMSKLATCSLLLAVSNVCLGAIMLILTSAALHAICICIIGDRHQQSGDMQKRALKCTRHSMCAERRK